MEKNVSINKINLNNNIVKVIKGSIIAFLISIMLLFIFASLLVYTNIQENTIKPVVIIISIISILVGSSLSSIKIKRNAPVDIITIKQILKTFATWIIPLISNTLTANTNPKKTAPSSHININDEPTPAYVAHTI